MQCTSCGRDNDSAARFAARALTKALELHEQKRNVIPANRCRELLARVEHAAPVAQSARRP